MFMTYKEGKDKEGEGEGRIEKVEAWHMLHTTMDVCPVCPVLPSLPPSSSAASHHALSHVVFILRHRAGELEKAEELSRRQARTEKGRPEG